MPLFLPIRAVILVRMLDQWIIALELLSYGIIKTTDIEKEITNFPKNFYLSQNYPNPFNPKTMISYQLPMTGEVELSIYNLLGQKVATLVNKNQPTGIYNVEWDATNLSTGVYYYKLQTGEFQQVKKMILMK